MYVVVYFLASSGGPSDFGGGQRAFECDRGAIVKRVVGFPLVSVQGIRLVVCMLMYVTLSEG